MDEPDIPMLDVCDFEVLDECAGEDDVEEQERKSSDEEEEEDEDQNENPKRSREVTRQSEREDMDENSGDNGDNILDVSIDVAENEFLENVAKDFSENIEDDAEEKSLRARLNNRKEPTVQIKKLDSETEKNDEELEIVAVIQKKPGPKSKTMNLQPKKSILKINFADKKPEKEKSESTNEKNVTAANQKNSNTDLQKNKETKAEQPPQSKPKTPAFLKKDLTDEEIMEHFDEIENTVLTSDTFVIQNDVEEAEKEDIKDNGNNENEKTDDNNDTSKTAAKDDGEENWDNDEVKRAPKIKIEEQELKESEMWYKEKIKAKENIVEEKFTKLAKIIQYSYPLYKKWLDRNESLFGTAICKVEPSKHSPLDQVHPYRWKFICNKKHSQQSSTEEENQAENTSDNKNVQSSWQMIPGVPDANLENTQEYPPFVIRVVKVFEDFLKSLDDPPVGDKEEIKQEEDEPKDEVEKPEESEEKSEVKDTEKTEDDEEKSDEKADEKAEDKSNENQEKPNIKGLEGLTVLLRCNRKEELMMHITGKNITEDLMDKIKDLFENGEGKDSNVKSVYCKTIVREDNVIKTNTSFLFGSETLDDNIGPVKIQLAPKANVWTNLTGVETLANAVADYIVPTKKTTVIEVGCGTGLISLLLATRCQKVIGVDIQKEIVEAEHLCEVNEIKNATFMTGKPKVVMSQIDKTISNTKVVAVINTNNVFGRSIEVITALRKMTTIGRIIIITTLTKQALRSILELTQPADEVLGNPFIPIKACIVDTSPKGFGFDIIMSMERRTMRNLLKVSPGEAATSNPVGLISKSKQVAAMKFNAGTIASAAYKKPYIKTFKTKAGFIVTKKIFPNPNFSPSTKYQGKRPYPGSESASFPPGAKKFKQFDKAWGPNIRPNPLHDKKLRDIDQGDLRKKLSSNRVEPTAIAQEVQEQKKILDAAKEQLTGVGSKVDNDTVKKLAEMLSLAIEKTNKLQSQLPPRSVWDRIAPADSGLDEAPGKPMKGRFVKETGPKEIIITTSNSRMFGESTSGSGKNKRYDNLPPLEPDLILPVSKQDRLKMTQSVHQKPNTAPYQKPGPNRFQKANYRKESSQSSDPWSRNKQLASQNEIASKWSRPSPPRRGSPPRPLMRTPPRQSPPRRPMSPPRRMQSPPRRQLSPLRRPASPNFRQHSSMRNMPDSGRQMSPPRRHNSPPRRLPSPQYRGSPPRQNISSRQKSPPSRRYADEWDIPSRGAIVESGWRQDKEKTSWPLPQSGSSPNWNQSGNNGNRYPEDKWDNPGSSSWNNKNPSMLAQAQNNSSGRWKGASNNVIGGSNWDVQKKDSSMRDPSRGDSRHDSRHEPRLDSRHESRNEPRHEPRWEPPEKSFRNEKDDWNDLPEDARDPWDDHPQSSQKDIRWNNQPNQANASSWIREKSNENWLNKGNFPLNNMGGGGGGGGGVGGGMNSNMPNSNMNMNMNMGLGMNNPNKGMWQGGMQQQQQARNQNWIPGNWQPSGGGAVGGGAGSVGLGSLLMGNALNNWQQQQQNYSNFSARPFNNNPFMNNRR